MSISGAGSVLLPECWDLGARDESGPTGPGLMAPSLIGEKWPEPARAAPDGLCRRPRGAEGSELVLLDESCDSSAFGGVIIDLTGVRGVTTGSSGSVRFLLFYCSRARGVACVKAKEGLQTQKTLSKPGLRWVATKGPPEPRF